MFDSLSDKLHAVFKKLRGESRLTESNIAEAMREIRLALLEADVNIDVAAEFIEKVKNDCLGQEVLKSVTPGQQVVRIVNDAYGEPIVYLNTDKGVFKKSLTLDESLMLIVAGDTLTIEYVETEVEGIYYISDWEKLES